MTGYELKTQCFDRKIANFWPADQAQIYRTLEKLDVEEWVSSTLAFQLDRPNRKIYQITEAGRKELARWLAETVSLPVHREPFLVQLYFSDTLCEEQIMAMIARQKAMHEDQLRAYEEIDFPAIEGPFARQLALAAMTLHMGMAIEKTYISCLEELMVWAHELPSNEKL
jgi:DNA-binding PadR family transcriptional regulator